jgi:hypothetical protein
MLSHGYGFTIFTNKDSASVFLGRRGRDRMVVGFNTTCTINAYHH